MLTSLLEIYSPADWETYIKFKMDLGKKLWRSVKRITEIEGDLTAIGDVIELEVLPCLREYLGLIANVDVAISEDYSIKSTLSGFLTLYSEKNYIYIHSVNDPMFEALQYVRSLYDASKSVYYVYGCGMGYHLYQIYSLSEGYTSIRLYEPNEDIYKAAISYGVLSRIPSDHIERMNFQNIREFLDAAKENEAGVLIQVPSMHVMADEYEKKQLTALWMWQNTVRLYEKNGVNIVRNRMLNYPDASMFTQDKCDEAVVVAAGPSLSQYLDVLRNWKKQKIIAVGTVFRKLMKEGIRPDCVVMIDPTELLMDQFKGLESSGVPLLLDENAYWNLARVYNGPVYFMRDWEYGGTVASAAIEVGIHMGASKLYLAGLDLGYPIMQSHTDGATGMQKLVETKLFPVEGTDGNEVLSDIHLSYYKSIIENQIRRHKDIVFINMSEHGARIEGTIKFSL